MAAPTKDACIEKQRDLWGQVIISEKYLCKRCCKTLDKAKYLSLPFSHFAVCILDDGRTTGLYYVVSKKDLYKLHRAVEGPSTENLNPVNIHSMSTAKPIIGRRKELSLYDSLRPFQIRPMFVAKLVVRSKQELKAMAVSYTHLTLPTIYSV